MNKFVIAGILFFLMASSLHAQEKFVDHYAVSLGLLPWEKIIGEYYGEASSLGAYQYKMAKEMATMHGGGERGDYHVLVVIEDKDSGQRIKDAEVKVVVSGEDSKGVTATLESMKMDGFAGYGGYLRFNFKKTYIIQVSFKLPQEGETRQVEFSNQP